MQLYLFLIITTLLVIKPTISALFLSEVGVAQLPIVFVLTAVTAGLVSFSYDRVMPRIALGSTIFGTLLVAVVCLLVFGWLLSSGRYGGWFLYLLNVWVAIFALLIASQFWLLANAVFNVREAKRLFGFIGAGGILGGICGGYLTSILAPRIGTANLLYVAAATLSVCLPLSIIVWRRYGSRRPLRFDTTKPAPRAENGSALELIWRNDHLRNLTLLISMGVFVAKLIDYQFGAIASAAYTDSSALAAFFGFWLSSFNILSLLIQLLLTRILLQYFGVVRTLFLLPGAILIGSLAVLFAPVLLSGIFLKMADASGKQSVNKAAVELLYLPVDTEVKARVKTFIDVFVDSFATGLSGLLLIFVVKALDLSVQLTSLLVLVGLGGWFWAVARMRHTYLKAFQDRVLRHGRRGRSPRELDRLTLEGLLRLLAAGTPREVLYSMERLQDYPNREYHSALKELIHHEHPAIRIAAIRQLAHHPTEHPVAAVGTYLSAADPAVRLAALEYMLEHYPDRTESLLTTFRAHADAQLRGSALLLLARNLRLREAAAQRQLLLQWLAEEDPAVHPAWSEAESRYWYQTRLEVIGTARIESLYPELLTALHNPGSAEDLHTAISAAGLTQDARFVDPLLGWLAQKRYKRAVRRALSHYNVQLVNEIESRINGDDLPDSVLREIPQLLGQWDAVVAIPVLLRLVDHPLLIVSLEALRVLTDWKVRDPGLKLSASLLSTRLRRTIRRCREALSIYYGQRKRLEQESAKAGPAYRSPRAGLIRLLERRLDGHLERLFRLLALRYTPTDVLPIYQDLRLGTPHRRASALEFLDNLLEDKWRRITPLVETLVALRFTNRDVEVFPFAIPKEREGLATLLSGHDVRLKLSALYLIEQWEDPAWDDLVRPLLTDADPRVRRSAERILSGRNTPGPSG
jgi:AAA family ATP:ADP antiporter